MVKKEKKAKKVKLNHLLTKMNLRTIVKSKFQFLAVIFITALAMTLYVGLTSNAKSIDSRVNKLYQQSNIADIWTTTSVADTNDQVEIEEMVGPRGETEARLMMPAKLNNFEATALMSEKLPTINKPAKTDNIEEENFFIVDEKLVDEKHLGAGLWTDENGNYKEAVIKFSVAGYQKMLEKTVIGTFDGAEKTMLDALNLCLKSDASEKNKNILTEPYYDMSFQVTGKMKFGENIQSATMNNSNFLLSLGMFRDELFQIIGTTFEEPAVPDASDENKEFKQFLIDNQFMTGIYLGLIKLTQPNQYVSKIDPTYNIDAVKENITQYFQDKDKSNLLMVTKLDMLPSNFTIQNDITQAKQLAYIFPIIFFLVAILVVLTTISQIILKDRIQIGTLKGLGLTNTKIIMHYMALAVYIVLIGVVLGMLIGPWIIPVIMNQKYVLLYNLPPMHFSLAYLEAFVSTLIVMAVTAFVTWLITRKTANLKPSEGMRPKEVKTMKASKKEGKITRNTIPFRMAMRNIKLNLAKSMMVVVGIAGCTSLLVCGFGIDDTLNHGVDSDGNNFFNSQLYATYNSTQSIKENLLSLEEVEHVEEYTNLPITIANTDTSYQTFVYVFDDNSRYFHLDDYDLKQDAIISNKVAKQMHLKVGDNFNFSCAGMNFSAKVGYILDCFYLHGIYLNASASTYSEMAEIRTNAWIDLKPGYDLEDFMDKVMLNVGGIGNIKSRQQNLDLINDYMLGISSMTLAVKVFAILLAVVVLYNLSLLNFKERMRDIATLKVLGFSKWEIASSLLIESFLLTLVGVGFGLLLGLPMEILVLVVNLTPVVEFLYIVYPMSYVISFLLTIGTTLLVNYFLTFKINKVKMVESLKSVE